MGGAGQNETGPADYWYDSNCVSYDGQAPPTSVGSCAMPLDIGDQVFIKLEAVPQDWHGAIDCQWLDGNNSIPAGGWTSSDIVYYMMQLITLSDDMLIDGCTVHLDGSRMMVNGSATNSPTITITNGGELHISSTGGEVGNLRAITSNYGVLLDIQDGTLSLDSGYIRDIAQNSAAGGALLVGSGATVSLINGSVVYGSPTTSDSMATIRVDGGTLILSDASVYNVQQTGTAIHLENTAGSSLVNIDVRGANKIGRAHV